MRENRWFFVAALCLFSLGLALRLHDIGEYQFWLDEALTGYLTVADDWLHRVHNSPPLYFLLLRGWSSLSGIEEGALRAFSALVSAAAIPIAMYTGRTIFDHRAGLAAGLILLISPISIYYAQEARPYSLLVTELLFVYWMLWRVRTDTGAANWLLLATGTAAAIYTHSLSVIPLGIGYLMALLTAYHLKQPRVLRLYLLAGTIGVCLYLPWFVWWMTTTDFNPSDMAWLQSLWANYTLWRFPADSLMSFYHAATASGGSVVSKQFSAEPALAGLALLGAVVMLIMGFLVINGAARVADKRVDILALVLLLLVPLLALMAISFVKPVYLPGRYDLIAYPAFVLLAGFAVARLHSLLAAHGRYPVFFVLLLAIAAPPATRALQFFDAHAAGTSASTARFVHNEVDSGDLLLMIEGTGIKTIYYLQLLGYEWNDQKCVSTSRQREFSCRILPISLESAPAAIMRYQQALNDRTLGRDVNSIVNGSRFNEIYLVVKGLGVDGQRLRVEGSISPVLEALQESGYTLSSVEPKQNLLHFKPE